MQDAILRLMSYWTGHGCVLAQPYNVEVGAGTLNPATFLRVLGPEPWRTAYVEPSVRPDDSRYGENPNRMQTHTQFQVVLKPDPGDAQELYLGSLKALGIDTKSHDVRFVVDNWESPALGAWGLGWEVWLDGLEITQFTYFQQAGGITLDPVSVEITYGLERILMAVQGAEHFKDIRYSETVSYGEIQAQAELELSTYYLDEADVETHRRLFEVYETQARRLVERGLALPAHNYVLRCSHAFNVLDSRGAVGATERARAFARMRSLAHEVAELWVRRREELGYPLGVWTPSGTPALDVEADFPTGPAPFALEIGTEELPPDAVRSGVEQLRVALDEVFGRTEISFRGSDVFGTPRRLVALIDEVGAREPERTERVRGPRSDIAFDGDGNPTKAAMGFARKMGVEVADLLRGEGGSGTHLMVEHHVPGRAAGEMLAEALADVVRSLTFERTMRWGAGPVAYARPIRWVTALLGDAVVPFVIGDVASGRSTRVLRDDEPAEVVLSSADAYGRVMAEHGITVDGAERRRMIVAEAIRLAGEVGGTVDVEGEGVVLDEVVNLVERPVAVLGRFDAQYLRLPEAVLTMVMRKHQRYLPVRSESGELAPYFVTVANGPVDVDGVRAGNEAVLRARYADAAFFVERDRTRRLEDFRPALDRLVFEERAGSMLQRAERVERVAEWVGDLLFRKRLKFPDAEHYCATLIRAAHLAKADLTTEMVVEMSSLAGEVGRVYALRDGESEEVADAIFEHTLPRFADDRLPESWAGVALAIADRADALVTLFAVGAQPTGSSDPYGLRRAALGLARLLAEAHVPLGLRELFDATAGLVDVDVPAGVLDELRGFVLERLGRRLVDAGHRVELVQAVLPTGDSPADVVMTLEYLEAVVATERFRVAGNAFRRAARIARGAEAGPVDPDLFESDAEKELWTAYQAAADALRNVRTLGVFVDRFEPLVPRINDFFDSVLVNADDAAVRGNRHRLLLALTASGSSLVDWDAIPEL